MGEGGYIDFSGVKGISEEIVLHETLAGSGYFQGRKALAGASSGDDLDLRGFCRAGVTSLPGFLAWPRSRLRLTRVHADSLRLAPPVADVGDLIRYVFRIHHDSLAIIEAGGCRKRGCSNCIRPCGRMSSESER